jgi:hypothetical protein
MFIKVKQEENSAAVFKYDVRANGSIKMECIDLF